MAYLDEAWDSATTTVVSLVAWGGVGKSALVNRWLEGLKKQGWGGAERVFSAASSTTGPRQVLIKMEVGFIMANSLSDIMCLVVGSSGTCSVTTSQVRSSCVNATRSAPVADTYSWVNSLTSWYTTSHSQPRRRLAMREPIRPRPTIPTRFPTRV